MANDVFTADVKLTPILKEYIVTKYGSDTIKLKRNDPLLIKIKYLLSNNPSDYRPVSNRSNYIKIEVQNFQLAYRKQIEQEYHNYLSPENQQIICIEINSEFKETFHNYVLAFLRGGIINRHFHQQKEAIEDFCQTYQLKLTKINYDMLKKSWDRSYQKKKYLNLLKIRPFIK